jgi:NLR family CARD domain-containing protein 3
LKTGQIGGKQKMELDVSSNCWICEGWTQMQFKLPRKQVEAMLKDDDYREKFKEKYGVSCKVRVTLHMNFDGYKAHKLDYSGPNSLIDGQKEMYLINRMVPPGKLEYFYVIQYSNELPGEKRIPLTTTDSANAVKYPKDLKVEGEKCILDVPKLNYVAGDIDFLCKILDSDDIQGMIAKPRPDFTSTPRPKTPWTFEKSFFTQYVDQNEQLMNDCFEFDWQCSKIEKWLERSPAQRDAVFNYLRSNYKHM